MWKSLLNTILLYITVLNNTERKNSHSSGTMWKIVISILTKLNTKKYIFDTSEDPKLYIL